MNYNDNENSAISKTENIADKNVTNGNELKSDNEIIRERVAEEKLITHHAKKDKRSRKKEEKHTYSAINGKNNGKNSGFVTAIVCLSLATAVLGGLLIYTIFSPVDDYMNYSVQEERNFYELVGYVDAIDVNLSKAIVSNDDEHLQKIFGEITVQSSMATENLSNLALHDEEKYYTTKFINQVGDYSKYLENKLIYG